jgi:hypothetical protein
MRKQCKRQEWNSFADEAIAMAKTGQDVSDPKLQFRGKDLMDRYREARKEFIEREEELRDQREASSRRTETRQCERRRTLRADRGHFLCSRPEATGEPLGSF